MKSLIEYLERAQYYFSGMEGSFLEKQRERAINYCLSKNLENSFSEALQLLPQWLELANSTDVKFYIEEPLRLTPGSPHNSVVETGVFLRIYDSGKTPVIKVVM